MRVLVTGAGGMVGQTVCRSYNSSGDTVLAYDHKALDISDQDRVMKTVLKDRPDVIINCAAWTDVDGCELDGERAFGANARGPENLANASRAVNAGFVTISTDYVFDGKKTGFYTQRDHPCPESVYGKSKLEGEHLAQLAYARTIVVRTGFVFGPGGRNFLSTIVERARRGEKLSAITDAYGTPTYAPDLVDRLRELVQLDLPGIYHVVNGGDGVSFEEFARTAISEAGLDSTGLQAVKMDSLRRPAPRPANSRLKCLLSEAIGLKPLRSWELALKDFVALGPGEVPAEARKPYPQLART